MPGFLVDITARVKTTPLGLLADKVTRKKYPPKYNRTQMTQMIMINTDKTMKKLR